MVTSPQERESGLFRSDRYVIRRKLGAGSSGTVYLARDTTVGRSVALKLMRTERLDAEELEELKREFHAMVNLHHPQLSAAYDFGYTESPVLPFYTREYIEGAPLGAGPPGRTDSPREFLKPFFDLLDAVHYLHVHDLLHLDIHAGNLIVARETKRGSVLIDFGLAGVRRTTSPGPPVHSRERPKVLADEPNVPATDLHAVGRLLLFRLTGGYESAPRLPREIPGWGARLTLELERIIGKALQNDPHRRFQSALEFRDALSAALGQSSKASRLVEPGEFTVGRDRELDTIEQALRQAASGCPAVAWFVGPGGTGKTRLLKEARLRAQLRGLEVVEISFPEASGAAPLVVDAIRTHERRKSVAWLEPLDIRHGGTTVERAERAVSAYFTGQGPPLVLLLDDLEHADRESRVLAEALVQEAGRRRASPTRGRGLAVVVSTSTEPSFESPLRGRRQTLRRLKPLPPAQTRALLSTLLRPLEVPGSVLRRFARVSRGVPLRLRQLARALHAEFGRRGVVPKDATVPPALDKPASGSWPLFGQNPTQLEVLKALAALGRPARRREIEAATEIPRSTVQDALRRLKEEEILSEYPAPGRARLYCFSHPEVRTNLAQRIPAREGRRVHRRMVGFLRAQTTTDPNHLGHLARHLVAVGAHKEGGRVALEAARALRQSGLFDSAVEILTAVLPGQTDLKARARLSEEISAIHEEIGDHAEGMAVLEPLHRKEIHLLPRREALRIRRRLGVHCHRAGFAEKALRLFDEVRKSADPRRDLEELIFAESELAELHTLRAEYEKAEGACRRGLELLRQSGIASNEFRDRMKMVLCGSLGHLDLRRMRLEPARDELEAASALASSFGTTDLHALLLNNLGIVYNQLNEVPRARRCYRRAERLLERSGERRGIIKIACNMASIAAKTGDARAAMNHLARAEDLLSQCPGKRLEFFVGLTRGVVSCLLGDMQPAMESLQEAIALGRRLGDVQSVAHLSIYLAESYLACGYYGQAIRELRSLSRRSRGRGPPVLLRMVHARLFMAEALVGRERAAESSLRSLKAAPRTDILLLEAWNDLFVAAGLSLEGRTESAVRLYRDALSVFRRLSIPSGHRFARVGLLCEALRGKNTRDLRARLKALAPAGETPPHAVLAVLEPLARAEIHAALGEPERAEGSLEEAAEALIGRPFLELDWRVEFLRASMADRRGNREAARSYVHRSLHVRDLLARSLPARLRDRFLDLTRVSPLSALAERLERPSPTPLTRDRVPAAGTFRGMIGRSSSMLRVFKTIDRLRDQESLVLVTGETGTGKELVAKALHETSPRRRGPFFALHCASLPPELFESELFGHQAGAFTGAEESSVGLLEHLAGGTLLLDEVSGLTHQTQAKLLSVLDSGSFRPLGGTDVRTVDIRFLASSNSDLDRLVSRGTLRPDLYFRLAGLEIHLPPLRARKVDIPALAKHFLAVHSRRLRRSPPPLTANASRFLQEYEWPGNVRQLEAVIVRTLVSTSPGHAVRRETLEDVLPPAVEQTLFNKELLRGRNLDELTLELQRAYLIQLFEETRGKMKKMMEVLDVKQARLYKWFRQVAIDIRALRRSL